MESEHEVFLNAIRAMMYSFGDVKEPLQESVEALYNILREEMNALLMEAERIAKLRDGNKISHKDLLFLMRKNKGKMKRLIEYLGVMDKKFEAYSSDSCTEQDVPKKKRVAKCRKFLEFIGDLGEYTSMLEDVTIVDEAYKNMLERRNSMTAWMDLDEYLEFTEKILQTSFCAKEQLCNFEKWLLEDNVINMHLTKLAFEIIQFLARETVSKIVDMALISKSKKNRKPESPEDSLTLCHFSNLAAECNISELLPSPSSTEKNFDHLYDASNDPKESVVHTTKSSPNNPESVTTDSHASAPDEKWADEDSLHPLSSFPGTSMDFVDENQLEDPDFFRNAKENSDSDSDSDSSVFQSTALAEDALSDSGNQFFIVEDDLASKSSPSESSTMGSYTEISKSYFQDYVAESCKIQNQAFQGIMANQNDEILIENISNDDDETLGETDANVEQSNTRHSSNDMAANIPYKNLIQDAVQSDINEKSENSLRKYYQESSENKLDDQTPITSEEIIQAVALYHQHSLSNFFYTRENMPKTKLLCIDEHRCYKS